MAPSRQRITPLTLLILLLSQENANSFAARSKGFGATKPSSNKTKPKKAAPIPAILQEPVSLEKVLNPRFQDPALLEDIEKKLKQGEVVILKDAFLPELADAMHKELAATDQWDHNEDYFPDGYHFRHQNIYATSDFPPICDKFHQNVFGSQATKEFISKLSGRDCTSDEVTGAPSYYKAGDHSLPHTDHIGQRTVAYVWHLSKNWKPDWGGALYWAPSPLANAFHHASYNSLCLFSVTPHSAHFVTTVSPEAKEKRLAYNGWWHSPWVPAASDPLEELLATPEQRRGLTHAQVLAIQDMLDDPWAARIQPPERHEAIEELRGKIMQELYPDATGGVM